MEHLPIETLRIEQWELEGLQWFVQAARKGELQPVSQEFINEKSTREPGDKSLFNMGSAQDHLECGTAACIGGWIFLHHNKVVGNGREIFGLGWGTRCYIRERANNDLRINRLFYPWEGRNGYKFEMHSDVQHAADVVERFLQTGEVNWKKGE